MSKEDMLYRQLLREQEHYRHVPRVLPVRIGDYVYYRKFDNPADAMTLYRFPLEEQRARGLTEGQMPLIRVSDDETIEKSESAEDFPEEVVFSIADLKQYYADFAQRDARIKDFVERVTDFVVTQEYQPLHSFQISEEQKFAVLSFDTEEVFGQAEGRQSFDLLVKDLSIDRLMPVLILNTDGQVAFDRLQGFFYTQVAPDGRGHKVFRHQLGTLHQEDVLIYEEKNPDFAVSGRDTPHRLQLLSGEHAQRRLRDDYHQVALPPSDQRGVAEACLQGGGEVLAGAAYATGCEVLHQALRRVPLQDEQRR